MAETTLYTHPYYGEFIDEWFKFRLVFEGGFNYVNEYLYKFSDAEDQSDFDKRKLVTYRPNHAKRAILKVRDAVFQRMVDVKRLGGPDSYQVAVTGKTGGVNRRGKTIGAFIGLTILPELLAMGRAFVFVDKKPIPVDENGKITVADAYGKVPYLCLYRTEDVLSWVHGEPDSKHEYMSVLLRDWAYKYDEKSGMPNGKIERYRKLWVEQDGKVYAQYFDSKMVESDAVVQLSISRISLVKFEINESLMVDIADYQIALLNLVSADMQYLLNANTGVYVEQFDPRWEAQFIRDGVVNEVASAPVLDTNGNVIVPKDGQTATGTQVQAERATNPKIKLGHKFARRYATQNEPNFIAPPTEPLLASMKKQDQLIEDIERLVSLKVENLSITGAAKKEDRSGLESGLSTIGLVLETGENQIADFWAEYEGTEKAVVSYPTDYSLKTDGDRIKDANELVKLKTAVPSPTFAKQISHKIARTMFGVSAAPEIQAKMDDEIEKAQYTTSEPEALIKAHQEGAIPAWVLAEALGFNNPKALAKEAQDEQALRLATIAIHQQAAAGARGVSDMKTSANDGKNEKLIARQKPANDNGAPA